MCVRSPFTDTHVIRPTTQIHLNEHRADLIYREILLLSRAGLDTYLRVQPLGARATKLLAFYFRVCIT